MRFFIAYLLFLFALALPAQVNQASPQVITAGSGSGTAGTLSIHYSIGEPVITTAAGGTFTYTQGFLQPDYEATTTTFSVQGFISPVSCPSAGDGSIVLNTSGGHGHIGFIWSHTAVSTSTLHNLEPGTYSVVVNDTVNGTVKPFNNGNPLVFIIVENSGPCAISIYNVFSPNDDNKNDAFIIDGIQNFPGNTVSIFSRWGSPVWTAKNYDNSNQVWKGTDSEGKVLDEGTYFYLVDLNDGKKPRKGWIELTK